MRRLFVLLVINCCRCNCFNISDFNKKICPSPFKENAGSGLVMSSAWMQIPPQKHLSGGH